MQCKEKIKIEPLSPKEAESLFLEELGSEMALDRETKVVMKSIVKECAGLPLGIITMARSMRGVTDMFEWNDSLVTLEESSNAQTKMEKVLMTLKLSYDRLGRHDVQQCFLSCALYPEDKLISKFELVEFFIDQGLIGGLSTRKKQYDRGLTILNKLGHACLLEFQHESLMKMNDLIRDMALYIMSATSIVKAGKGLTRIPSKEYWTNALEKVSLMENKISEFPSNMSPNCPKLSILLLNGCLSRNAAIPDSFFKNLLGLEVLNLSECKMRELPNSISDLVNLRVLLLRKCRKLQCIPYLGKLTSLRKLDARGCKNLKVLEGLEKLEDLRYLDLIETGIERLPKGTLDYLVYLQCLEVSVVNEEDITRLGALDIFGCYLENANDFNECVRVIEQSNPRYYNLNVDLEESKFIAEVSDGTQFGNLERRVDIRDWGHAIVSVGGECTGISILIPQDVQTMTMKKCNSITNLSSMGPLEYLEKLEIEDWENLETPCGGQDEEVNDIHDSPTPPHFPNLRVLKIYECPKLKYLCGHGSEFSLLHLRELRIGGCEEMVGIIAAVTSPQPYTLPFFPSLEEITIEKCNKMKRAVESEWMPRFPKLRSMIVSICDKMEEIIKGPPPYVPGEEISLESLNVFCCDNMRKLFSHEWLLHLRNLQNIYVDRCKGMVEMVSGAGQGQEGSIMTHVNNTLSSFQLPISLPKLKQLELYFLPQLKSICKVPISCDFMKELMVLACPELKGIPLQLRLHKIEFPYITSEGEELAKMVVWDPPLIAMEGELLKTVMWDPPEAQAILQLTQRRVRF